jgi:2-polyprenyl-3-methyl-5-hydroxy-6-metoxy-1,4-benzoquinol methylase
VTEGKPSGEQVRAIWDELAAYWDRNMESGGTWQRTLIAPAVEGLLLVRPGERILEVACGNGDFSRRMAELGASVVATDVSEQMLKHARARGGPIDYRRADATSSDELLALGDPGSFDAMVCNMAIMDMPEIEPMAAASRVLLRPDGRAVISTVHPAFNGSGSVRIIEQSEDDGGVKRVFSVKTSTYIRPRVGKGVAIEGQPVTQWYFDRPISELFGV